MHRLPGTAGIRPRSTGAQPKMTTRFGTGGGNAAAGLRAKNDTVG